MSSSEELTANAKKYLGDDALLANGNDKWIIAESDIAGRGVIASQDISVGETIFVDRPLICGPRASDHIVRGCAVCTKTTGFIKCPKCGLRLCSKTCCISEMHSKDCTIIQNWTAKVPVENVNDMVLSKALAPIRALALNENERNLLLSLQAHVLPQHGSEVKELRNYFDLKEEYENFLILVCCVLDANAFLITSSQEIDDMNLRGLYPVASLMNHECVPNTRHQFDSSKRMVIKASKFIPAKSEIFTCYTCCLWGTPARRYYLSKTKHFSCECARCTDPSEFGTNLAALRCLSPSCDGDILPSEPLCMTKAWKCMECSLLIPAKQIGVIQSALASLMGSLVFDDISHLEDFFLNEALKYFPSTNQTYVEIMCKLIWKYGITEGCYWKDLSERQLSLKLTLCRKVLGIVDALAAGQSHLRGILLYHLHAALAERAHRHPQQLQVVKLDIENSIEEAYSILQGDVTAPSDLELRKKYFGRGYDGSKHELFHGLII